MNGKDESTSVSALNFKSHNNIVNERSTVDHGFSVSNNNLQFNNNNNTNNNP